MKSNFTQIRDLAIIEKELTANKAGILGFFDKEENLVQQAYPYLYANKNIYLFLDEADELLNKIIFEASIKFTVLRPDNYKKNNSTENQFYYKIFQITFNGKVRIETEKKVTDELYKLYLQKYGFNPAKTGQENAEKIKVVFLDTEEIDATEKTGV